MAQCVEYYYTWKKIMRLGRKHRTRLSEIIEDCVVSEAEAAPSAASAGPIPRAPPPPRPQVCKWLAGDLALLPDGRWPWRVTD